MVGARSFFNIAIGKIYDLMYRKMADKDRIYDFLAGLKKDLDEGQGQSHYHKLKKFFLKFAEKSIERR